MRKTLDIWPGRKFEDMARIDIFYNDLTAQYSGNIYDKNGHAIGDYTAQDWETLKKMFPQFTFNWGK